MASKKDQDFVADARKAFARYEELAKENHDRARDAIRFRALEQWPDSLKRERENANQVGGPRPCPVMDKTNQYVRRVVNDIRRNTPAIRYRPGDGDAHPEVAAVYDGIVRHIQDRCEARVIYATAAEQAVDGGFGYWRILTEYCSPTSFDQRIVIKLIPNRFSVLLGPHDQADASDCKEGFVYEDISQAEFKSRYPKKQPRNFETVAKDPAMLGWFSEDNVRIAEYIRVVEEPCEIVLLQDGTVLEQEEYDELKTQQPELPDPIKTRTAMKKCVKWCKLSGTDILEEGELPGTHLGIVKVTGNDLVMPDGTHRISGLIESAMDPQRLHNYSTAKFIESVALAPLAPYVSAAGQTERHPEWADANRLPFPVLPYDPVETQSGALLPPPRREPPAGVPAGWQQLLLDTEHGIEAATGLYGASIGGPSRERSGVALQGQQQQGEVGSFHYGDNLHRSIRYTGKIIAEWIPLVMDTARDIPMLGVDNKPSMAKINPEQEGAVQENPHTDPTMIGQSYKTYNLGVGTYEPIADAGPDFLSSRQEASSFAMELTRADPTLMQKAGDKILRLFDVPEMREIADRLKLFLPPQVLSAEEGSGPAANPAAAALMQQAQKAMQEVQARAQQLAQMEQDIKNQAQQVGADQDKLKAAVAELKYQQQTLLATERAVKAELELAAMKLAQSMQPPPQAPETPLSQAAGV